MIPLVIVMPVYNEAGCLKEVLEEWLGALRSIPGAVLLAVDDGSRDATPAILDQAAARASNLRVIHQENAGHGAAVLRGYREALAMGAEWVFQSDSDRQIAAEHLAPLWAARGESAFLQGARLHRDDPKARIWLSRAHRLLLRAAFGRAPRDPNIPFRLMRGDVLYALLRQLPERPFAPNVMLSLLAQRSGSLREDFDVPHRPRRTGAQSIHGWKTARIAWRVTGELWRFRWGGYRR